MRHLALLFLLAGFLLPLSHSAVHAQAESGSPLVLVLTADMVVTPAMKEYIQRGIEAAERREAEALIIELNTPGGTIDAMTDIVQSIRASNVPVIVYVTPRGGMAASAGAMITLAGHASAMAPETIIGAASPVGGQGEDLGETLRAKEMEALKATVRTLAAGRGEEAVALGEAMIDQARAVSATEALEAGVVDFVAADLDDLIAQLDGFAVEVAGAERTLETSGAQTEELSASFIEQLLDIMVNPNIVFLLLSIGVQALLMELSSPGGWVAGFVGAVCLLLAAYGLGVLPVNWFGIIFIVIAFVLFIADVKAPTHGALTAAGIGSLIVGALVLFNSPGAPPTTRVSIPLVIGVAIVSGILFGIVVGFAVRAQRVPVRVGMEAMVHKTGVARSDVNPTGQVQAAGELWTADLEEGAEPVRAGERVEIVSTRGMRVRVRKLG